jgi:hypothetical protein
MSSFNREAYFEMIKSLVSSYQNSGQITLANNYQIYMNMIANAANYPYGPVKSELGEHPVNFSMSSTSSFETSSTSPSESSFGQHQLSPQIEHEASRNDIIKRKNKINFGSISDLIN